MKRVVWGLAGKYCAGKNRAAKYLEAAGCLVLDADKMGHIVLEEQKGAVVAHFGADSLDSHGKIDRRALGAKVFGNPEELKALERIVHPPVIKRIKDEIESPDGHPLVINAALLFSSNLYELCDKVIWVSAPLWVRIKRGKSRDGFTLFQVLKRIWTQRKLSPQPWRKDVDIYSIPNPGSEKVLKAGIGKFLERE
ncbi:MAG: dephospho-CoA kinase [Spirochaetales bacterium]|nr:dephospho-CoA kinase [Spirochaetales bacterium]